jgi:hypothetical protein
MTLPDGAKELVEGDDLVSGHLALLQRLAHVYLGPDVKLPPMDDPPPGYVMRITAERIAGVGSWVPG